ncbi:hypothetical protein IWZ03DRAFT_98539 [Phyllosticta citriasiana]|uniref:MYND-type zinc finger protein samB n=1 Tax=Phyllosticta citriasiana TaxID=595635 RepID=A0ABR1KU11_9PEZI
MPSRRPHFNRRVASATQLSPSKMATEIHNAYKKPSPVAGNGLFAKNSIPEGELIFSIARPLLTELESSRLILYCSNCFVRSNDGLPGSRDIKISACTGCRVVSYCSKTCQSIAWKRQHKPQCSIWKGLARGKEIPHAVRLVAQALVARKNGKISDEEWAAFKSLPSHVDKLRERDDFQTQAAMAMGALKYSGVEMSWDFEVALEIYARILTNSLTITTPTLYPIGIAVDPFASCANHSCEPNAFVVLEGSKLYFRALKPISKDEEIFMSYVDDKYPFLHRQKELRDRYYFDCKCSKCEKGCDTMEDRLEQPSPEQERKISRYAAALVGGKPAKHPPEDTPLPATDEMLIYRLGRKLPRRVHKPRGSISPLSPDLYALEAYALDYVERTGGPKTMDLAPLMPVMWLLSSTGVWPSHRQPFPDLVEDFLRRVASEGMGRAGFCNLGTIWLFGVYRYILIDPVLFPAHHPLRTLHAFSLANWSLTLLEESEAKERQVLDVALGAPLARRIDFLGLAEDFLREAQASVVNSHGPHSRFAQLVIRVAPPQLLGDPSGSHPSYLANKRPERMRMLEDVAKVVDEKKSSWFRQMIEGRFMETIFGKRPLPRQDDGTEAYLAGIASVLENMAGVGDTDSEDEDEDYHWLKDSEDDDDDDDFWSDEGDE